MIVLAGVGVIADVSPVTGAVYAKFAKVFKPSKQGTKGVSNGIEQVIREGVDAGKTSDSIVHILMGNIKSGTRQLSGGHLESALPSGSVVNVSAVDINNPAIYQAEILWTDANGITYRKPAPKSTMFPKTWTPTQTLQEITSAYQNAAMTGNINGTFFIGNSTSGVKIQGRLDANGKIVQANPTFPQ